VRDAGPDDQRVDVLGVAVSAVNLAQATDRIERYVDNGERNYVTVTGVHGVVESQHDPELLRIHNRAGLTTPDGMPIVWACKRAGAGWVDRVYGPDLMLAVCARAAARGWTSYFYGASEGVAELLARNLSDRFPGLKIAGVYSPPFRPLSSSEDQAIVDRINEANPDLLWVSLGTPKQERWMASHSDRVSARVLLGVGAAFDIHAGVLPQAPLWMQRSGVEWFYRLVQEPRRLVPRYLRIIPAFLWRIARRPPTLIGGPGRASHSA